MNKEELIKELKKSRRQTKDERYEYINSHFNQTSYAMRLEKYTRELYKENKELHNKIDKLEDELEWYKQECDDLEMSGDVDECE